MTDGTGCTGGGSSAASAAALVDMAAGEKLTYRFPDADMEQNQPALM